MSGRSISHRNGSRTRDHLVKLIVIGNTQISLVLKRTRRREILRLSREAPMRRALEAQAGRLGRAVKAVFKLDGACSSLEATIVAEIFSHDFSPPCYNVRRCFGSVEQDADVAS